MHFHTHLHMFYGKAINLFYSSNSRLNEIYFFLFFPVYMINKFILEWLSKLFISEQALICDMKAIDKKHVQMYLI